MLTAAGNIARDVVLSLSIESSSLSTSVLLKSSQVKSYSFHKPKLQALARLDNIVAEPIPAVGDS